MGLLKVKVEQRRATGCHWVNSFRHLEHIVLDLAGLRLHCISDNLCCSNGNERGGIDSGAEEVDSQQPESWLMHWWTDEITLWVIFVPLPHKEETIAWSCRSCSFSFEGTLLQKFNFEVLISLSSCCRSHQSE